MIKGKGKRSTIVKAKIADNNVTLISKHFCSITLSKMILIFKIYAVKVLPLWPVKSIIT